MNQKLDFLWRVLPLDFDFNWIAGYAPFSVVFCMLRTVMRFAFLTVPLVLIGCSGGSPTVAPHAADPIRAAALVDTYRDFPDVAQKLYTSQLVTVRISRGSYRVQAHELHWYVSRDHARPPALICHCPFDPGTDNDSDILVTGRCRGRSWDGTDRGDNTKFFIRIEITTLARIRVTSG